METVELDIHLVSGRIVNLKDVNPESFMKVLDDPTKKFMIYGTHIFNLNNIEYIEEVV